jgi:hypothetical protein
MINLLLKEKQKIECSHFFVADRKIPLVGVVNNAKILVINSMPAQQKCKDKSGLCLLFIRNGLSRHFGFFSLMTIVATKSFATEKKKLKCLLLCTITSVRINFTQQHKYSERSHINKVVQEFSSVIIFQHQQKVKVLLRNDFTFFFFFAKSFIVFFLLTEIIWTLSLQ